MSSQRWSKDQRDALSRIPLSPDVSIPGVSVPGVTESLLSVPDSASSSLFSNGIDQSHGYQTMNESTFSSTPKPKVDESRGGGVYLLCQ